MRVGRFLLLEERQGKRVLDVLRCVDARADTVWQRRYRAEQLGAILDFLKRHQQPGDPDPWTTVAQLFPQEWPQWEKCMVEILGRQLTGEDREDIFDMPF